VASECLIRIHRQWRPDFERTQVQRFEVRRQDSDNCEWLFVEKKCLPDDVLRAGELRLPEAVCDYDDVIASDLILFG
jgi:hypothetical protein